MSEQLTEYLSILLEPSTKRALEEEAERQGRKLSSLARFLIKRGLAEIGLTGAYAAHQINVSGDNGDEVEDAGAAVPA